MRALGHFFTVGWAVYPIAFTCPTLKYLYSIADFFNKAIYSIALQN
jgi:hypothetical protein